MRYGPTSSRTPRLAAIYLIAASSLVAIAGFLVLRLGRTVFAELETVPPRLMAAGTERPWLIAAMAMPALLWGLLMLFLRAPARGLIGFLLLLIPIAVTLYAFVVVITSLYSFEL